MTYKRMFNSIGITSNIIFLKKIIKISSADLLTPVLFYILQIIF